jgi:hypothetical protein
VTFCEQGTSSRPHPYLRRTGADRTQNAPNLFLAVWGGGSSEVVLAQLAQLGAGSFNCITMTDRTLRRVLSPRCCGRDLARPKTSWPASLGALEAVLASGPAISRGATRSNRRPRWAICRPAAPNRQRERRDRPSLRGSAIAGPGLRRREQPHRPGDQTTSSHSESRHKRASAPGYRPAHKGKEAR